ncbi:amino acid ABC transporter substrate-binding protein [Streptomyces niveus]|uniref:amino acid ABC transporter substrate-binding protein n=1 Tax=Streptomyces niveus TaxID=193462 RepID=UPI003865F4B2
MWPTPGRRSSWPRPPEAKPDIATAPAPIRIGYCLSLTGSLADNSRSARLAHEIWREDINARGGLLGRPVEFVRYDDQGNADLVPGIYERLIDEDKVDLVIGGYGTSTLLPAMPLMVERERFFVGLMGLGVNNALIYPNYFAMIPTGPDPNAELTEGFFALAAGQNPRPTTVALVSADAEFSRNPILGAKANAEKYGIKVVHEVSYPLSAEDFTPLVDAVAESGSDLLFLCSYLADSIGLVRTVRSHHYRPKMVGGAMIGPQNTAVKTALGPLLNGFVNYEYWAPVPKMMFPGVQELLNTYQERAGEAGVDLLGHYMAPLAYAQMQVVAQAVEATGGLDDASLSAYAREKTFPTVMGDVRFGAKGEWSQPRVLQVQFQGITGHEPGQFRNGSRQIVVAPPESSSGELIFPYAEALTDE